ncbi:MAG: hypothetical protein K1X71_09240 [Pirellulales bacterium]|nr:hypothetical protein [Pirellulales bacterium]
MSRKRLFLIIAGISALAAALVGGMPVMVWDGGFGQVEYQIRFVDSEGAPIPGVQLRVENEQGANFFHYPVTDYAEGRAPASGDDGVLTFHHVGGGPEFSGRCTEWFGICFGECNAPIFICRFLLDGKEVYRSKFNDMNANATQQQVLRVWNHMDWLPVRREGETIMDVYVRESDHRDRDDNGDVDRGEQAAFHALGPLVGRAWSVERGSGVATENLEFMTYQATVVVK